MQVSLQLLANSLDTIIALSSGRLRMDEFRIIHDLVQIQN